MKSWVCPHRQVTETDHDGYAICVQCGATVVTRLTRRMLDVAMAAAMQKREP